MTEGRFQGMLLDQITKELFDEVDDMYNMKPHEVTFRKSGRGLEVIASYLMPTGRSYRRFKGLANL